jgi:hypothetical protein
VPNPTGHIISTLVIEKRKANWGDNNPSQSPTLPQNSLLLVAKPFRRGQKDITAYKKLLASGNFSLS